MAKVRIYNRLRVEKVIFLAGIMIYWWGEGGEGDFKIVLFNSEGGMGI